MTNDEVLRQSAGSELLESWQNIPLCVSPLTPYLSPLSRIGEMGTNPDQGFVLVRDSDFGSLSSFVLRHSAFFVLTHSSSLAWG
jgi:hypothetical protein